MDLQRRDRGRFMMLSAAATMLAALLFVPGMPGEFIFDDIPNITTNPAVQVSELSAAAVTKIVTGLQLSGTTRSLPTLTFALDYWRASGPDSATFKTTNLILHAVTTLTLAGFFRSLLLAAGLAARRASWAGPLLAFVWAAHPLQVSSVLYVVQRIQTMGTLFVLLALWAYLQARRAQIAGRSGRTAMLATLLLWIVAMGCKEDSALLPGYALALELTVLRFGASDAALSKRLRQVYCTATIAALAAYFLVVLPHFWHGKAYWGRDFSAGERLLTQPRVLCMYLGQILLPLPKHMPFYYDWLQPSRSIFQPWTTAPAFAAILTILGIAWRVRARHPLFAFGVLLFFCAHMMTSNVIGLELAFEHRNHLALVGAILAIGCLIARIGRRYRLPPYTMAAATLLAVIALSGLTLMRAHAWRSTQEIARIATASAPGSGRAWTQLCASYFSSGGGSVPNNPFLDRAIETCAAGTEHVPHSLNSLTLLIVLKSLRGDDPADDWSLLQRRIDAVPMTRDNARIFMILTFHARKGVPLDKHHLLETLSRLARRGALGGFNTASIGYFVMNDLGEPELALPYFEEAIKATPADTTFPRQLGAELRALGRSDLAQRIEQLDATLAAPQSMN